MSVPSIKKGSARNYASARINHVRDLVVRCQEQRRIGELAKKTGVTPRSIYFFINEKYKTIRAEVLFVLEYEAEIMLGAGKEVEIKPQDVE